MSYGNFSNLAEAKDVLVKLVKCEASLFFEAECQESTSSSWHIVISKVVRFIHFPPPNQNEELKEVLAKLTNLRQNIEIKIEKEQVEKKYD